VEVTSPEEEAHFLRLRSVDDVVDVSFHVSGTSRSMDYILFDDLVAIALEKPMLPQHTIFF
jgi:hypothetical protein